MNDGGTTAATDQLTVAGLRMLTGTIIDNSSVHLTRPGAPLARDARSAADVMKIRQYPFAVASVHGRRRQDPDGNSYLDFLAAGGVLQAGPATRRCALEGTASRILARVVRFRSATWRRPAPTSDLQRSYGASPG